MQQSLTLHATSAPLGTDDGTRFLVAQRHAAQLHSTATPRATAYHASLPLLWTLLWTLLYILRGLAQGYAASVLGRTERST